MGRYEVLRLLGEGGMGRVYLARQLDLGRQVVVKVMHDHIAADLKFRERFTRETLLMARFQHPYAVTLYDASLNDPQGPCIVMEYIRGISLDQLLQNNGRLTPAPARPPHGAGASTAPCRRAEFDQDFRADGSPWRRASAPHLSSGSPTLQNPGSQIDHGPKPH